MYYILYAFLYTISLLPFFILYGISDFAFFILYYIMRYRRDVVMYNLEIAFPEKTPGERNVIARKFYRNLTDTFIETIKLLSISKKELNKRALMDLSKIESLIAKGKNVQMHSGHQMNWEYGHQAVANGISVPWVGVYMRIKNKAMERFFYKLRFVGKTILVPAQDFRNRTLGIFKQQYAIGLISDQNPGDPAGAFWLYFFNKPVSFVTGPDKAARLNNSAIVFVNFVKLRRGFYRYDADVIIENGAELEQGELTRLYRDYLENAIRKQPDNYLWSHRRWKWPFKEAYKKRWIDVTSPPEP